MVHSMRYPGSDVPQAKPGDLVCISYTGRLAADATVFDAAEMFQFIMGAGAVIAGLDAAVAGRRVGEEVRLIVHYSLAYGAQGAPGARVPVPPLAHLDFSLRLHWIGAPPS